ncbi:EAL domain-containing protein [Lactococcus lactis]|uniref:EAL domain-containing protein n=1 Tax=Lactococcus lactis TaxID=1358 RepID=UPI0022DDDC3C|nr:EAL domain-containing protein [Lactococcus lactis]WBM78766.1 EAL domain-containing protein [Lactococcus lactis]
MNDMNSYYLVYQPIIKYIDSEKYTINDYEVLLRSKRTNQFPSEEFDCLILNEAKHTCFLNWFINEITRTLNAYPNLSLSLNFHPEQWRFENTLKLLEELAVFSNRIIIDSTEHSPLRCGSSNLNFNQSMTALKEMGYRISFDDVSTGINSMSFLLKNIENIYRIKFSIIHFKTLDKKTLCLFIRVWSHFAEEFQIEFVIEGIEDIKLSQELYRKGIKFQQGYLFGKGDTL